MKIKKKKFLRIIILIVIAVLLAFLINFTVNKIQENKFKKILKNNDSQNYELVETVNGEETKTFVRDKTLLLEDGNIKTWVSEFDSKRVIYDEERKTAIIDENDESLKVNSLNYTYINDFFENSNQKFKYLGKENGCYKLQFKENKSKKITLLYLNEKTNIVEKMIQNAGNFELVTEFKVEKNKVSKEKIAYPDLTGYRVTDSVNSNPSSNSAE